MVQLLKLLLSFLNYSKIIWSHFRLAIPFQLSLVMSMCAHDDVASVAACLGALTSIRVPCDVEAMVDTGM